MRVALMNPCFWPEVRRGSERFVRDLADGLLRGGHEPRLITSHPGSPTRTVEDGLEVARVWRPPEGPLLRRGYERYLTHLPFSYRELARGDDDLVHALYATDGLAAARWRRRTGRPFVYSFMGLPHRTGMANRRLRLRSIQDAIAGASVVVALSRAAASGFQSWLGVEARVIHPGVDLDAFKIGVERATAPTIFCGAAAGEPRKRVGLLVEAFRGVRRERPTARLVLSRPADPVLARTLVSGEPGVELADVDDRSVLARHYGAAWVSALPAYGEAFGLVLVEAMACGTPVVGSDEGAIPEVADRPEAARLWRSESGAGGLTRALLEGLELSEAPGTALACREQAERFSLERCVEGYVDLYRELLDA